MRQDERTSKIRDAGYARRAGDRRRTWHAEHDADRDRRAVERRGARGARGVRGARGAVSWRTLALALAIAAAATLLLISSCVGGG